jgi:hypothetical protein
MNLLIGLENSELNYGPRGTFNLQLARNMSTGIELHALRQAFYARQSSA